MMMFATLQDAFYIVGIVFMGFFMVLALALIAVALAIHIRVRKMIRRKTAVPKKVLAFLKGLTHSW